MNSKLPRTGPSCAQGLIRLVVLLALAWSGALPLAAAEPDARRDATVEVVERVLPSVVNVGTKTRVQQRGYFYDWWRDNWSPYSQEMPPRESAGSGVIIDDAGYVLTNVHVIEGADEVWVSVDGKIYQAETVVGSPKSDVALLKLRTKPGERFKAARFAADDDLLLGETVVALGNPFGLGGSVSRGILSSKSRRANAEDGESLDIPDWLQTDAAINPGNSGGPLINLRGEVIGINVAVLKVGQGIGFAIPIKRVSEALSEIFTPETLRDLWFGARVRAGGRVVKVTQVQAGSPADKAGLKVGDAILTVNDRPARGFIDFTQTLIREGTQPVSLSIRRAGETKSLSLRCLPESRFFNAGLIRQKIGVTVEELPAEANARLRAAGGQGVLITDVETGSQAARSRLQPGYIIESIGGRPVGDITTAAKFLYNRRKGEDVELGLLVPWQRAGQVAFQSGSVVLKTR
ncbi:MAG TPA: trypsin-like peptidase domain-containing protein [Verrucomicrobiae bacterium]|nr:trypsin-like peptidase domain-containing protein [Verrucomicrobiae bacterium]